MPEGQIVERFLDERYAVARITCPWTVIPMPGQYVLAHNPASDDPLAVPVFSAATLPDGFLVASRLPDSWLPGTAVSVRGPLGRGFTIPATSRKIALVALDVTPAYLLGLIPLALQQDAAISLVCDDPPDDLPADVEIRPLGALAEICQWADYLALAATRESMLGWRERIRNSGPFPVPREAQALIITPVPCGGLSKCGVCSIEVGQGFKLVCEDGPVFNWRDLF